MFITKISASTAFVYVKTDVIEVFSRRLAVAQITGEKKSLQCEESEVTSLVTRPVFNCIPACFKKPTATPHASNVSETLVPIRL